MLAACGEPKDDEGRGDTFSTETSDTSGSVGSSTVSDPPSPSTTSDPTPTPPDPGATAGCDCGAGLELAPVPDACADVNVPPAVEPTIEARGWLADPNTIRATTHEDTYCSTMDLDFPNDLECPCSGGHSIWELEFEIPPLEVGPLTATFDEASAACRDVCEVDAFIGDGVGQDVEIVAATDTCVVADVPLASLGLRLFVDRTACP